MDDKIMRLQKILDKSQYTVALCGSGMMEESGFAGMKDQDLAYILNRNMATAQKSSTAARFIMPARNCFLHFTAKSYCPTAWS